MELAGGRISRMPGCMLHSLSTLSERRPRGMEVPSLDKDLAMAPMIMVVIHLHVGVNGKQQIQLPG